MAAEIWDWEANIYTVVWNYLQTLPWIDVQEHKFEIADLTSSKML
jgi:hypothetical protein